MIVIPFGTTQVLRPLVLFQVCGTVIVNNDYRYDDNQGSEKEFEFKVQILRFKFGFKLCFMGENLKLIFDSPLFILISLMNVKAESQRVVMHLRQNFHLRSIMK